MYLQATTTYGSLIPGSEFIRSLVRQGTISPEAAKKLRWMDLYLRNRNAYQFSARDVVTRFDAIRAYKNQTSLKAAHFLRYLRKKFPYPIKAIQIDGGSEFKDQFEEACRSKEIPLFLLPPKSPKLNGHVERPNRTHREEFYEVYDVDLDLEEHNKQLAQWEHTYNYIGPHQSLDYLTPYQYYRQWKRNSRQKALPM